MSSSPRPNQPRTNWRKCRRGLAAISIFFLHGSMSTEFVPVNVCEAFERTYLFVSQPDLSNFGLIPDADNLPIGYKVANRFSAAMRYRTRRASFCGINCAAVMSARSFHRARQSSWARIGRYLHRIRD